MIDIFKSLDKPELRTKPGHVYEVWSDGEITMQKSGNLYGLRNLHQVLPPALPPTAMTLDAPFCIAVESKEDGIKIRQQMLDWWYKAQTNINNIYLKA